MRVLEWLSFDLLWWWRGTRDIGAVGELVLHGTTYEACIRVKRSSHFHTADPVSQQPCPGNLGSREEPKVAPVPDQTLYDIMMVEYHFWTCGRMGENWKRQSWIWSKLEKFARTTGNSRTVWCRDYRTVG